MAGPGHRHELLRTEDTEDLSLQRPQRRIVGLLACPRELSVDDWGKIKLEGPLQYEFMRLYRLQLHLGPEPQTIRLAEKLPDVGSPEDGSLPSIQSTLLLPDDARVLGFRFREASDKITGFADVRDLHVLLDIKGTLHLEPLCRRYIASSSVEFPGRSRWIPAALGDLEKSDAAARWDAAAVRACPEVIGLKCLQGTAVDHLVEVEYVGACAGFAPMFWIDLLILTCALFYVDIVLDVKQLVLFASRGLYGYLTLNLAGMALPPIFTTLEAIKFCERGSPEKDRLDRLLPPTLLLPAMIAAIITQSLMAVLVTLSALAHRKHPLLAGAKGAEVAESAMSALVQTNFLISALGGISQIRALELSDDQLQSLVLSVAVSCFSLGLGFASRDKADSAVLDLPGKLGWSPSFAALIFVRFLEVLSRVVAYSVLQISLRGYPLLRFTGLGAGAFALLAARVAFPDASWADVAAAIIAHPGQILEPQSLFKLRYSLMMHVVLVAAGAGAQMLLRAGTAPTSCKVLPDPLLIGWLVVSLVSWAALGLLSWLGHHVEQPRLVALVSGGVIAYSTLLAAFPSPDDQGQAPKAVLAALQGKFAVDLATDAAARGLTQEGLKRILESGGDARFHVQVLERLAIPQEAVVEALARSHPTILHLPSFQNVPADCWERLGRSLDGDRLRKVDVSWCFYNCGEGSQALLAGLARCRKLQELLMDRCWEVPGEAWKELRAAAWPELRKASFEGCFYFRGEGSEELLAALGRSRKLEEVNFASCGNIPAAAWESLPDGAWPRLRLDLSEGEHLERLRKASPDIEAGAGEAASSSELQEPAAKHLQMYPAFVTSVVMTGKAGEAAVQGDLDLLPALARSDVEELILDVCRDVPAAVWQQLGEAPGAFQKLRKASFRSCFNERSKGAEGAGGLLFALSRCQLLQELNMYGCSQVPAAAWQLLATARWEQLRKADFTLCFNQRSKGVEGAEGLLLALSRCRQLQDLSMGGCDQIPAAVWQQLVEGARWPRLAKVNFSSCFGSESKGIEAAAGLLAFLGRCPELQDLSMGRCDQIPAAAWQQLVGGAQWPRITNVNFDKCFGSGSKGIEAAAGLLAFLGRCPELQELNMRDCSQVPAAAWQLLATARWEQLRKADFTLCFNERSKGAEGAEGLLSGLARCRQLQALFMAECSQIPAAAWRQLEGAHWPRLTFVDLNECFDENSKGADGVAGILTALARCPELKDDRIYGLEKHKEELRRLRESS